MTLDLRSTVLLASAGTGKTFQLSNRYLGLVLGGTPVEEILASTFTRKAAGEILNAILERLAEACADPKARKKLAEHLHLDSKWTQEEAVKLLQRLLRQLPQIRVGTLDSWFQRQVGAASLDLGLTLGWRLAETFDFQLLHRQAVEETLLCRSAEKTLQQLAALQDGKPKRSMINEVEKNLGIAASLWKACAKNSVAWEFLGKVKPPSAAQIEKSIEAIKNLPLPLTQKGTPIRGWESCKKNSLTAITQQDWNSLADQGLFKKILDRKNTFHKHPIPLQLLSPVVDVLAQKILYRSHLANCAIRDFARDYAEILEQKQAESGLLNYDDFPAKLAACSEEQRQHIDQRLGVQTKHLLLDEFQDTSVEQWMALHHPITTALAAEKKNGSSSVFVVGDQKQSIYGFREGEPRLLNSLAQWFDLKSESMSKNFRSSQIILDAVNNTFTDLTSRFDNGDSSIITKALASWKKFPHHRANNNSKGVVRVLEVCGDKANKSADNVNAVLDRAIALYHQSPEQSLGILVRKNSTVAQLLAHLSARGIRACAAGGNLLVDSEAVDTALSLFQLADHPGDTAAWFHIASSPLAACFHCSYTPGAMQGTHASRLSRLLRTRLLEQGYGLFLEKTLSQLRQNASYDPWNLHRFSQFVNLGRFWDARASLRPTHFADFVRQQKVASQDMASVQVMTIHQAKGLAFDSVVLLVDAESRKRTGFFAYRPDPRQALCGVGQKPKKIALQLARHLKCTDFIRAYEAQEARDLNELLCVLYVGMTRARQQMELILPKAAQNPTENSDWIRSSGVIRRMVLEKKSPAPLEKTSANPYWQVLWQTEELPTTNGISAKSVTASKATVPPSNGAWFLPNKSLRMLPRWAPSSAPNTSEGKILASSLFTQEHSYAKRRGIALHRLFEEIEWLDDFKLSLEEQRHILQTLDPNPTPMEVETWLKDFSQSLNFPQVQETLCRPTNLDSAASLEVLREHRFAVPTHDPHGVAVILEGIYDRVVLSRQGTQVVQAEVLDFKTGKAPATGTMPEAYALQLKAYRQALAIQYGLQPEQVQSSLLYVEEGIRSLP